MGVIGGGSYGTALANVIAENFPVKMYLRKQESIDNINIKQRHRDQVIHPNIIATDNLKEIADTCSVIIPVIPSYAFRTVMKQLSPYLTPSHIIIHGTKGFDVSFDIEHEPFRKISPKEVYTMSEVVLQETSVIRVGCISGPNLSKEIADKQPAATVVASRFHEVVELGQYLMKNDRFLVYGSNDIKGIELAGILKNYIAIAAGACAGLGYGENVKALLITRGMAEMIYIGNAMGVNTKSFLGLAGIGDLIATCSSPLSRNFNVGYQLANGKKLPEIVSTMTEAAEGIKTVQVMKSVTEYLRTPAPLVSILYKIFYKDYSFDQGIKVLMHIPVQYDAEYIN